MSSEEPTLLKDNAKSDDSQTAVATQNQHTVAIQKLPSASQAMSTQQQEHPQQVQPSSQTPQHQQQQQQPHTSTTLPPKAEAVQMHGHQNPLPIQPAPPPMAPQHGVQQSPLRPNTLTPMSTPQSSPAGKPQVGSEEWHRQRRENHKEVERRRRDTINQGINELAKIVPGCEKNKGSILQRAVQYITQLKENEAANIEKWTLEKLLTEQAMQDLQAQVDLLKNENQRLRTELEELQSPAKKKQRTE